jgi:hypothetical protein
MKYLLLLLLASPARAADYATVAVSSSTPTKVTATLTGVPSYKTVLIENGGSNPIYCSRDPNVTTNTGHKVGGSDSWRGLPYDGPVWCIAATASQTGTGRDVTIVWGSYQ